MNVLEQRYRRVLRMLPASYRQMWEDDMVATFLASTQTDDAEDAEYLADYGRPSWSEVASVAMLAIRLRVGGAGRPPLSIAWSEAVRGVRLVALVVLLLGAVTAPMELGVLQWLIMRLPWFPVLSGQPPFLALDGWRLGWSLAGLIWVAAYVALVFGYWRAARWLTGLALAHTATVAISWTILWQPGLVELWADLLVSALLLVSLMTFHQDTPPLRRRPWLVAFAVGIVVVPVVQVMFFALPTNTWILLDWSGLCSILVVAAGALCLTAHACGLDHTPSWALALALLALATLVLRAVSLWDYAIFDLVMAGSVPMTLGVGQLVAVLAVGFMLAVLAGHGLRRFSPLDPVPSPRLDG